MPDVRATRALLALLLAFTVAACAAPDAAPDAGAPDAATTESAPPPTDDGETTEPTEPPPEATADEPTTPAAVPEELQFTSMTLEGEPFDGADLAGSPAVLWFWAPWCPICQGEAPEIADAASAHSDVTFVGVAAQDDVPPMQEFVDTYDLDGFTHLADTDAAVWAHFGVTYQPAFAFIDAEGTVDVVPGRLSPSDLDDRLTAISAG